MKILFAIDQFEGPVAGTETQFWLLLNALTSHGTEAGVMLLRPSRFLETEGLDIPIHVLNVTRLATFRALLAAWKGARWARRNGFQVVHTFLNDSSLLLPWAMRACGIRVVVSRRDEGFWYTGGLLKALKVNRLFVHKVVANSRAVCDAVMCAEGYESARISVIHNGIDAPGEPREKTENRRQFDILMTKIVFLIIANLRPLKRIDDAIRAFAQVYAQNGDCLLLVAGEDRPGNATPSYRKELEAVAIAEGVSSRVRFLGHVGNVDALIAASDIGVLCSETEGLSNTIMQYMRGGLPVVASKAGGNAELVADGQTGFLVDIGDTEDLARRMLCLAEDKALRDAMGRKGKEVIAASFSTRTMVEHHLDLYRTVSS